MNINQPTQAIADFQEAWERNADVLSGARAVKRAGLTYLPLAYVGQDAASYAAFLKQVSFAPTANRTHDGITGLIMREDPVLETSNTILTASKTAITSNGDGLEELCRLVVREMLGFNWGLLVTDYPRERASSLGAAVDENKRPFLNIYRHKSVLEVTGEVRGSARVLTRVRALDDDKTVRMWELVDGQVRISIYRANEQGWFPAWDAPTEVIAPKAMGRPLTEIPAELLCLDNSLDPQPALLDHIVDLDLDHYVKTGELQKSIINTISPMVFVFGVEGTEDQTGQSIQWTPNKVFTVSQAAGHADVVHTPSDAAVPIERQLQRIEEQKAVVASRILARHKAAPEAAETEMIRQGAENSVIAMIANAASRKITKALRRFEAFSDAKPAARFHLNTNFLPTRMSAQEITAMLGLSAAAQMSDESFFYQLRSAGWYDETLTWEVERERRAASQPVTPPAPTAPTPQA